MNGIKPIDLRWSDLDPVGHMKHSVYYDLAASQRIGLLHEVGLGIQELATMGFGPVLFKEVCAFRREIRSSDQAHMTAQLIGLSDDLGRFAFRHEFFKGEVFCARLEVSCAWIDLNKRKLTTPPERYRPAFDQIPRSDDFSNQTDI
jgi:acyl-CoA thioester hydrolase